MPAPLPVQDLYVRQEVRESDDVAVRPVKCGRYYRDIGLLWRQGVGRAEPAAADGQALRLPDRVPSAE